MMSNARKLRAVLATLALGAIAAGAPAAAQDAGGWRGQITPYVWASGLGGDITPFTPGPTVSISKSFSEILKDLDAAFFISGFARRDRIVVMGDLSYSSSSKEGLVLGVTAEGKVRQTSMTLAAGYRAVDEPGMTLDLLGGARLWRLRGSVSVAGVVDASPSKSFVDPIVAVRANFRLAPQWSMLLYGDFGGFGVGSRSTSQLVGTVNYEVRDGFYLSGGYRVLNVDYRSGGTRIDASMRGPLIGATWRF
jgi:hypothetical protein